MYKLNSCHWYTENDEEKHELIDRIFVIRIHY